MGSGLQAVGKKAIGQDRQLNLAELMKTSSIYKTGNNPSLNKAQNQGLHPNEFIKGTSVTKDFQLIAEPLQPKPSNQMYGGQSTMISQNGMGGLMSISGYGQQQHPSSAQKQQLKTNNPIQQISHPNTATATIQDSANSTSIYGGSQISNTGSSSNHQGSRQVLDNYYSNVTAKHQQAVTGQENMINNNQQPSQQYISNRSVAAKAGQMQIFNNDIHTKFQNPQVSSTKNMNSITNNQSQIIGGNNNAARKFVSPPASHYGKFTQHVMASHNQQQILDNQYKDFQGLKIGNSNTTGQISNPKYVDYINRFQITDNDQTQTSIPKASIYSKLHDDHSDMIVQQTIQDSTTDNIDSGYSVNQPLTSQVYPPLIDTTSNYKVNTNFTGQQLPRRQNGTSTTLNNLNISGEQMQLDSKGLNRKITLGHPSQGIQNDQQNRNQSLSQKRQDLTVQAKSFTKQAMKLTSSNDEHNTNTLLNNNQVKALNYDYIFIQMTHEQYDKDFSDKQIFLKESGGLSNSPSLKSIKDKRVSQQQTSINNSSSKKQQIQGQQVNQTSRYKGVRGSQDNGVLLPGQKDQSFFSPQVIQSINATGGFDDLMNIQSVSNDVKYNFINVNTQSGQLCLQSTNIDHVKVIINPNTTDNITDSDQINEYVQDIIKNVQQKGRRVKISQKKNYLLEAIKDGGRKVASMYVLVVGCNQKIDSMQLQENTISKDESGAESELSEFNQTMTNIKQGQKVDVKKYNPVINTNKSKPIRIRNNSTINSKGATGDYESETESRSMNSTTTSSTAMHFMSNQTRNHQKNDSSIPQGLTEKNSARSMSQKGPGNGSQPRRLQQKALTLEGDQSQTLIQTQVINFNNLANQVASKYGPTKIKVIQNWEDYSHHKDHRINLCLNNYNLMLQLLFRTKGKLNIPQILQLAKSMGLSNIINKNQFSADGSLKAGREQANMIKEKLIAYLCKVMQEENVPTSNDIPGCEEQILQPQQQYKCFVGKGNNSILIRTLFKTRYWWLLHDKEEIDKVNFMWTQLKKNPIMDTFACKFEDKKSGLRLANAAGISSSISSTSTLMQTPTMSSGKMKKKRKNQLQSSTQSLEGSGDKKDTLTTQLATEKPSGKDQQQTAAQQQLSNQLLVKLYNKLEDNFHLSNKKAMFLNMRIYYEAMGKDVFSALPVTFHIKEGVDDPEFSRFKAFYNKEEEEVKKQKQAKIDLKNNAAAQNTNLNENGEMKESVKKNIWIIKPGENTNRGNGIMVSKDYEEIKSIILESTANKKRTCIVQKYIHNPLLINKRKFDIRLYAFMSSVNGNMKAYFYQDGYIRTSCREFTLQNLSNRMIHLTNDAVQKKAEDYGKYEAGNKLSYNDLQNYLDKNFPDLNICFDRDLLPQMKKLVTDTFRAVHGKLDPKRRINTFEIYGFDFMFDDEFKVFLIEVNTNPCLELGCPLLARLIPSMVENALRLVVDPLFPPPENWSQKKCVVNDVCPDNKFELIFDEKIDGPYLTELMKEKNNIIIEIDEEELSDCDEREDNDN